MNENIIQDDITPIYDEVEEDKEETEETESAPPIVAQEDFGLGIEFPGIKKLTDL